jgi:hypothetical protein
MRKTLIFVLLLAAAAQAEVAFTAEPTLKKAGDGYVIEFALSEPADVEVAVVDAKGNVVRHLAAGVPAENAPPPLAAGRLAQKIAWDGKDDAGEVVADPAALSVRIRAGMSVELERIVGGDPYAYFSAEMGQGDHAKWRISGLEVKPDGTVHVLGNATHIGPPALRAYTADGEYLRTVFPPPADLTAEKVAGWGVNVRPDGTWSPRRGPLVNPSITTTMFGRKRAALPILLPSREKDRLVTMDGDFRMMALNTDGTIAREPMLPGRLVNDPSLFHPETNPWKIPWKVGGPVFTCLSADGESFYLSGVYAGTIRRLRRVGVEKTGFWRDGQVYKVDLATRKAEVFFALDAGSLVTDPKARQRDIGEVRFSYASLHGVAVDGNGHVFVCDRLNRRLIVLDRSGQVVRELPVSHPDAVAVAPGGKAVYVVTRKAHYGGGRLTLVKFADWSQDEEPAAELELTTRVRESHRSFHHACVAAVSSGDAVNVWVAHKNLPVRIYRDERGGLKLLKDFYEATYPRSGPGGKAGQAPPQRCLGFSRVDVHRPSGDVYVSDTFQNCFRIADWDRPRLVRCMVDPKTRVPALDVAFGPAGRRMYALGYKAWAAPVRRYRLDGERFAPDPLAGRKDPAIAPRLMVGWMIGIGHFNSGFDVGPGGGLVALTSTKAKKQRGFILSGFRVDSAEPLWDLPEFGKKPSGCVRFDRQGNLYVGIADRKPEDIPAGFEDDRDYARSIGRIRKYAPTAEGAEGLRFPKAPAEPERTYDVHFGHLDGRPAQFDVDGYGRIYYPTSIAQKVGVIDNAGNRIVRFGTYGNRDSTGGLPGGKVRTGDIPMGLPLNVVASGDYIYVGDTLNCRLLRIRKRFKLEATTASD